MKPSAVKSVFHGPGTPSILLLCLLTSLVLTGCRSGMGWLGAPKIEQSPLVIPSQWHHSYESARQESLTTGKPILMNFTGSDWCHWCVKLKQDVFSQREFQAWARDNVVLLEVDFPKRSSQSPVTMQQNQKLAEQFAVEGYPTVMFLDVNGQVLGKPLGYLPEVDRWLQAANTIVNPDSLAPSPARDAQEMSLSESTDSLYY
jgi:thioredoxin-related protein